MEEVRAKAHDLAERISQAKERYEGVAIALLGYAPLLEAAQRVSLRALGLAQNAVLDQRVAQRAVADAHDRIVRTPLGVDTSADLAALDVAAGNEAKATQLLDDAVRMLQAAVAERDAAAEAARRIVDDAKAHDGLKDSRWDNVKSAVVDVLKKVSTIADWVAVGAGLLALVFAAVPFVGEFFAAVALYAAITSLALKLTLKAFGEGSWKDIGVAALGVATFGVGKVAMGSAEVSALGARGAARLAAGRAAARAPAVRAVAGLPTHGNPLMTIDAIMGSGNAVTRTTAEGWAEVAGKSGLGPAATRAWASLRSTLTDDIVKIAQFDVRHPVHQFRTEAVLHPLAFLGERGTAAQVRALSNLHPVVRAMPEVRSHILGGRVGAGVYVATWATGDGLLYGDARGLINCDPSPAEILKLTGTVPRSVGGHP